MDPAQHVNRRSLPSQSDPVRRPVCLRTRALIRIILARRDDRHCARSCASRGVCVVGMSSEAEPSAVFASGEDDFPPFNKSGWACQDGRVRRGKQLIPALRRFAIRVCRRCAVNPSNETRSQPTSKIWATVAISLTQCRHFDRDLRSQVR